MKKTLGLMLVVGCLGLGQDFACAKDHPELSEGDEAYSAENYPKAAALYRKYAELGVIEDQVNLAIMCMDGQGVPQDFQQAAHWFSKAAEQGNAEAQQNLGQLYLEGKGVVKDPVEADKWFHIAKAGQGIQAAEKNLSPEQIAEATRRAKDWFANYQKTKSH